MKPELESITLINNETARRFELPVSGQKAIIEYDINGNRYFLTHTEVPEALEGQGIGSAIVEKALMWLEAHEKKVVPLCPMVSAFMRRHPEWKRLLAQGVNL